MNIYKAIKTELGILAGRDCILLDKTSFIRSKRSLILKGSINNYITDKTQLEKRFSKYLLTFTGVLAFKVLELDSWEEIIDDEYFNVESSFDEISDSTWIKELGGKANSSHHHYLVQTYDDVFNVVCAKYEFKVMR